jgi:hypothetical protein
LLGALAGYGRGKTTGLRLPSVSTARTKKKLSFDTFSTTYEVTLPTQIVTLERAAKTA